MDLAIDKFDPQRFGLITGSACSVLFPVKSAKVGQDTYARKLANEKYFRFYDEKSTWQTDHGNWNEHGAFEYFQRNRDKKLVKGRFIKKGEFGGTSDAEAVDYGADFKCPTTLEGFIDYLHDPVSPQQLHQAQMYMYLFDKEYWIIAAYLTETFKMSEMGLTYPVPADKRMIINEVKRNPNWADMLHENSKQVISDRDMYFDKLVQHFGEPKNI